MKDEVQCLKALMEIYGDMLGMVCEETPGLMDKTAPLREAASAVMIKLNEFVNSNAAETPSGGRKRSRESDDLLDPPYQTPSGLPLVNEWNQQQNAAVNGYLPSQAAG